MRTGDLIAALGGTGASPRAPAWSPSTMRRWGQTAIEAPPRATPTRSTCVTRALSLADQSGDAGFTRTPGDDACAYTRGLSLIKRSSADDKPLAGAKLRIIDDRGRILTADGAWSTNADACVTTGADGHVELSGVDAGVYTVEEIRGTQGATPPLRANVR